MGAHALSIVSPTLKAFLSFFCFVSAAIPWFAYISSRSPFYSARPASAASIIALASRKIAEYFASAASSSGHVQL